MTETFKFCPRCARPMIERSASGEDARIARRVCPDPTCGFVQWGNPTPAVGALVEHDGEIILARNALWPEGWFALITGYLEAREEPKAAVEREVKEELNLDVVTPRSSATNLRAQNGDACYQLWNRRGKLGPNSPISPLQPRSSNLARATDLPWRTG